MDLLKPNVDEDLAKDLVKRLYGMNVTRIKKLVSYDDQNFHIHVSTEIENPHFGGKSDNGYTLKITNTQKSAIPGHFDTMHATMEHLSNKGLRVPLPLRNVHGRTWSMEKVPLLNEDRADDPGPCGVHVLSFIPGVPLSTVECTKDILRQWGVLLAKFHEACQDLNRPELRDKFVFWNLENIPKIRECMFPLPEAKKQLVKTVLDKYFAKVENLKNLPKGVIHGDFNENNVLVQKMAAESEVTCIVDGILDFEDVHEGTYTWDVAVMMAYALLIYDDEDALLAPELTVAGYRTVRSLNDLELSCLKICMECRLCQSLVMGAYSFNQDPNNTYLLESSKKGWTKLELLMSMDEKDLYQKWKNTDLLSS